jgi:hypothetical protein
MPKQQRTVVLNAPVRPVSRKVAKRSKRRVKRAQKKAMFSAPSMGGGTDWVTALANAVSPLANGSKRPGGGGAARASSANVPYNAPRLERMQMPMIPQDDPKTVARNNVFGLLSPYAAWKRGLKPKVSDSTFRATFPFTSRYVTALTGAANGSTYDIVVGIQPVGNGHIRTAATFSAGGVATTTTVNDPTYSSWSTFVDQIRMVSCEVKLRNTTQVANVAGVVACGRSDNDATPFVVAANTFGTYADGSDYAVHSTGKPGDVIKSIWLPVKATSQNAAITQAGDWTFGPYNSTVEANNTCIVAWFQAPVAQGYEMEVVTHWEAIVLPSIDQLYGPTVDIADPTFANSMIARALARNPASDMARTVENDDLALAFSVASDLKLVYEGVSAGVGLAKKAWSWVKGLFQLRPGVEDALVLFLHQGGTIDLLRNMHRLALEMKCDDSASLLQKLEENQQDKYKRSRFESAMRVVDDYKSAHESPVHVQLPSAVTSSVLKMSR